MELSNVLQQFQCLRCGYCCENLIRSTLEGVSLGLLLFPEEIKYFQKDNIVPCEGFGTYPEDDKFKITTFQLNRNVCPHLKKVNKQSECIIFDHRPLVCKCYPLHPISKDKFGRLYLEAYLECRAIQKFVQENPRTDKTIRGLDTRLEVEANYQLQFQRKKLTIIGQRWLFDLKYSEWTPISIEPIARLQYIDKALQTFESARR